MHLHRKLMRAACLPLYNTTRQARLSRTSPAPSSQALGLLFDASYSAVQLVGIRVTSPSTIEADWKLGG